MCTSLNNMIQLLVLALLASAAWAEDVKPVEAATAEVTKPEAQSSEGVAAMKDAESAPLHYNTYDDHNHEYGNDHLYLKAKLDGPHGPREGPPIARNLKPTGHGPGPNIAAQDEIIKFTYSPVYYEPVWVLDYRFLKSGGRRYTRGPGGQVLILPRSYKPYKGDGTGDYDELVEFWRLKLIADQNKRLRENGFGHPKEHGHGTHSGGEIYSDLGQHMEHRDMGHENMEHEHMGYRDMGDGNMRHENMRHGNNGHRDMGHGNMEHEHTGHGNMRHESPRHSNMGHRHIGHSAMGHGYH